MSGHSKWSQIKRKKALTDAKKGRLFSKLSKIIELAAKKGVDPKTNLVLKKAVDQAKVENMPVANIERAIKKGSGAGADGSQMEEIIYEAYGPGGAALLIKSVTDNKNRATAEIKHILSQHGANLSGAGSVKWLFASVVEDGEIKWRPKQTIKLSLDDDDKLSALLSDLDDQDDVSDVYTNVE
ncbi:MAG: YebC/PmpR family DNA-binding transcriptional regulator [Parcubacteria group bacterium]|nr:YebC/PmpR family DNA-binding transcriptional regulator [Parcubacteria group bacterium]